MGFALSPSVTVREIDLTGFIPAVSTTGGAFVGEFEWGPVEEYTLISDRNKLEKWFGKPTDYNYEDWFTALNFLAYSNNLNIIRVVEATALNSTAEGSGMLIKNETNHGLSIGTATGDNAMIVAKYPGSKGNSLKFSMCDAYTFNSWEHKEFFDSPPGTSKYAKEVGGYNDEVHMVVIDEDGLFTGIPGALLERYSFASKASDAKDQDGGPSFYGSILNRQSQYVWWTSIPQAADDFLTAASDGEISSIDITYGGAGYEIAPTVTILGAGTGAAATANLAPTGSVKSAVVGVSGGTGYKIGDIITLQQQGGGVAAKLTVTGVTGGVIDTVSVTVPGSGYSTIDEIVQSSVSPVGGTGATFDLTLGYAIQSITVGNGGQNYRDVSLVLSNEGQVADAVVVVNVAGTTEWNTSAVGKVFKSLSKSGTYTSNSDGGWTASLVGGNIGGDITANELVFGWNMFKNAEVVDVSLLILGAASGGVSGSEQDHKAVIKHVIDNIAEFRKDCVAFFSPTYYDVINQPEMTATLNVVSRRNYINTVSTYAVMDSGWKYQYDAYNDKYRWVPLNADVAGTCARTDDVTDPWYSPAGYTRGQIKNVIQLALNPSRAYRDELYKNSVNPVVSFKGEGVLLYGDRTQLAKPSVFQKLNVRRLFIVLEKAIATAAKYMLFEFNDSFTRAQFVNMVEPYLREVKGRRGIYDFKVVCDDTNNTPEVIDRSEFIGDIYIKPAMSINFIQLNFIAVRTGVEFEEVIGKWG